MPELVIDASATLPWCFGDEATDFTRQLLRYATAGAKIGAPAHWPTEVLNGLIRAKRRGRATDVQITRFLADLNSLNILIDRRYGLAHWENLRRLADKYLLTSYDAAYLELAIRSELPLATLDAALRKAATEEQVQLL